MSGNMIQIWCKIIDSPNGALTAGEFESLLLVGADQYKECGKSHDGLRLLHCLLDVDTTPLVESFLAGRGQEPEIVKASHEDGRLVDGLPFNESLFESFFPWVQVEIDGVPQTKPVYDDEGLPTGEVEPLMRKVSGHQFGGWKI